MKAIKRPKVEARQRTRLENVIPLYSPFSIQIDVCSACNFRCSFCVHSDDNAVKKSGVKFGLMDYGLFMKIIDDMKTVWGGVHKVKKLRLFQIGEPLLHPQLPEMIRYAKKADIAECIELTSNGSLLTNELSNKIINAGLDILNISINGINADQYNNVCNVKLDFDTFYNNIKYFYENKKDCKLYLKYSDIGFSEKDKKCFYDKFGDACDEIFVETISSTLWQDTNINQKITNQHKGTYGQKLVNKKVCPFIFTTLIINNEGLAHLCCVDWKSEYILGDCKTESIVDIWHGDKLKSYQKTHLSMNKDSIPICRKCESLSANNPDNIDDYAEEILERIK